jgi:hypothetical protein
MDSVQSDGKLWRKPERSLTSADLLDSSKLIHERFASTIVREQQFHASESYYLALLSVQIS